MDNNKIQTDQLSLELFNYAVSTLEARLYCIDDNEL